MADQLQCIEEIKEDMEKPIVMDRLVCGDVGYGKTEIAFRAAFKAVMDGKQVALPRSDDDPCGATLPDLHEAGGEFPVRSALLSRIVPPKRQKQILVEVAEGKVDVPSEPTDPPERPPLSQPRTFDHRRGAASA